MENIQWRRQPCDPMMPRAWIKDGTNNSPPFMLPKWTSSEETAHLPSTNYSANISVTSVLPLPKAQTVLSDQVKCL